MLSSSFAFAWWAPLVLGGGWLATHWLLRESAVWRDRNTDEVRAAQRDADYAYRLAVDPTPAKELRLFNLADWTLDRFVARRTRLHELQYKATRLREKPLVWSLLLVVCGQRRGVLVAGRRRRQWQREPRASRRVRPERHRGVDDCVRWSQLGPRRILRTSGGCAQAGTGDEGRGRADDHRDTIGLDQHARARSAVPKRVLSPIRTRRQPKPIRSTARERALVLDGFDLVIPAGTSLAIVGQNGAGKTTLAKLLCRLYDPLSGAIEIDGVDLRELALDSWRERVTAVFQDFTRFELPLRDNVAPAGAPDEVDSVGAQSGGRRPSRRPRHGSRARLRRRNRPIRWPVAARGAGARARAPCERGAGLVLLDEPTAQLDVRGEAEIFNRILAATRHCTTILISHRFSTVRHADRICVLEHGRVVELGTHDELMAKGGRYRTMFELQAERFDATENEEGAVYDVLG